MEAKDYPVTFPYGATTAPYSPAHPHLGEDRKMPKGTPIPVNGVLVGYAGSTGKSTGDHTHNQRQDKNGKVINPQGGGFEVPKPTVVTETGYKADSIGYYVRYRDGNGFIWSIFHMDKPASVRVGQQLIKGDNMQQDIDVLYKQVDNLNKQRAEQATQIDQLYTLVDQCNKNIEKLQSTSQVEGEFKTITVLTKE